MGNNPRRSDQDKPIDLWCVHIIGPDDIHAAPSKAAADERCIVMNEWFEKNRPKEFDGDFPNCRAETIAWNGAAEGHAKDALNWNGAW